MNHPYPANKMKEWAWSDSFWPVAKEIKLVGDVHQGPRFDLGMTLGDPGFKQGAVKFWVLPQSLLHGVDDEVQEIGFIGRITLFARKYNPVGTA